MAGVKTTVRGWVARWWLLAQSTLAGTVAWVLARLLDDQRLPFFAPIAAIVVLNFARGERGLHAVRLIIGVAIGIGCGELAVLLAGSTIVSLAAAVFVAMTVTMAVTQNRLALNQAGAAAVLTVIFAGGEAGYERMVDALLGVGVALVFTQVIFTPEPIALVRRAERQALRGLAAELHRTARALARSDHAPSEPDLSRLRELRGQLADVGWAGAASQRAARRSVLWRHRVRPLVPVTENAGHLELLGSSCIHLPAHGGADRRPKRPVAPGTPRRGSGRDGGRPRQRPSRPGHPATRRASRHPGGPQRLGADPAGPGAGDHRRHDLPAGRVRPPRLRGSQPTPRQGRNAWRPRGGTGRRITRRGAVATVAAPAPGIDVTVRAPGRHP